MRKLWLFSILVMLFLTGCSRNQSVDTKEVGEMLTSVQNEYDFIYYGSMYTAVHPRRLVVSYVSFQDLEPSQIEGCFESTRAWITQEENLNQIQEHLGLVSIPEINICIQSKDKIITYTNRYHKKGSRDSQHKSEDTIDYFSTWDVFTQ